MSGMNTSGTSDLRTYNSRIIAIEVTDMSCQDISRTSNYTVKVPYSRMSQAMQRINRMGGKVASVTVLSSLLGKKVGAAQELLNGEISPPATYSHVNEPVATEHSAEIHSTEPVIDTHVNEPVAAEHSTENHSTEPVIDTHVNEPVAAEPSAETHSTEPVIDTHVNEPVAAEPSAETHSTEPVIDAHANEPVAAEHSAENHSTEPVIDAHANEPVAAKSSSDSEKRKAASSKAFQPTKTNGSRSKRKPKS